MAPHNLYPLLRRSIGSLLTHTDNQVFSKLEFERVLNASAWRMYSTGSGQLAAIKELREKTGAPMKDVKQVLVSSNWDIELAFTELRKKGLAAASKKQTRVASDGLLGLAKGGKCVAVVEINTETDFVARNDIFQHLVQKVAAKALEIQDFSDKGIGLLKIPIEAIAGETVSFCHPRLDGTRKVQDAIAEVSSVTGEKVQLRRAFLLKESSGVIGTYLHSSPQSGLARMVGLVSLSSDLEKFDREKLQSMADNIALHTVAAKPLYLDRNSVPPEVLTKEKEILLTQASTSGKSATVLEKMVEGRLRKFYEDVVLLEQTFALDEKKKVQSYLEAESKVIGGKISVEAMVRLEVGEGVEKVEKDFATEVLEQVGKSSN